MNLNSISCFYISGAANKLIAMRESDHYCMALVSYLIELVQT
jgi:hypothetical protein